MDTSRRHAPALRPPPHHNPEFRPQRSSVRTGTRTLRPSLKAEVEMNALIAKRDYCILDGGQWAAATLPGMLRYHDGVARTDHFIRHKKALFDGMNRERIALHG